MEPLSSTPPSVESDFKADNPANTAFMCILYLVLGEIVNGLSYILTGIGRGSQLVMGRFNVPITIHNCFYTRYWPIPLILGTEIPSWMTILVSA
ncbi:hypothetical protein FO519_000292 [Halicephalobus sp. NKZ332]|nr:hypothetical protein FO519_000292 [Halicephalobus sp. NKZ332]